MLTDFYNLSINRFGSGISALVSWSYSHCACFRSICWNHWKI